MPRKRLYKSDAERVRAWREKNGLGSLTLQLPTELLERFEAFLKFKDKTKSEVIGQLIEQQLLRKR